MAGFFDFLMPPNSGLDPVQAEFARKQGFLNAATQLADMSANHAGYKVSPLQLLTHGVGAVQSGFQGAMDQFYKNKSTQAQGAADAVSTELSKQDLDWQKKNNNFDAYKNNLSDPTKLTSYYRPPAPVAQQLGVNSGIPRNNPGNLKDPKTGEFRTFNTPEEGMAAMRGDINAKVSGSSHAMSAAYGPNYTPTLDNLISVYAPAGDHNNPQQYAQFVAQKAGMDPSQPLKPEDVDKILPYMAQMENGQKGLQVAQASPIQTAPAAPSGMSPEQNALYLAYLGERQLRSPKSGGTDLLRMGVEYNPNLKKNTDESVSYADWQKMTPQQQEDYKKYKTAWQPAALGGAGLFNGDNSPDTTLTGEAFLQTLPAQMQSVVKMIANSAEKSSTILSRMKPQDKIAILDAVSRYKADYTANQFGANKEWGTGKLGNTVRSLNVASSHLDTLGQLADALGNGDVKAFNSIGNKYASETGGEAPTNFETAKQLVADEIVKAVVGTGGGVGDREEAARVISAANSPAQLKGAIATYKALLKGQLHGLQLQYKNTTGKDDFQHLLESSTDQPAQTDAPPVKKWVIQNGKLVPQ